MTVEIEVLDINPTDTDTERIHVTTEDAAGEQRTYRIGLSPRLGGDGYTMHGKRVDGDYGDRRRLVGPSNLAWDAAAEHFRENGWEVVRG